MVIELDANGNGSFLVDSTEGINGMCIDLVDPMYKLFLDHLRKDGRSYILEMEDGDNGKLAIVNYEKVVGSDFLALNSEMTSGHYSFDGKELFVTPHSTSSRKSDSKGSEDKSIVKVDSYEENLISKHQGIVERENFVTKYPRLSHSESGKSVDFSDIHKSQPASNLVDDTYQKFLSCLTIQDGLMVLEYNSVSVVYEGNEPSTAVENLTTEGTCFSDSQGPLPSESTQPSVSPNLASNGTSCSQALVLHESFHQPDLSLHGDEQLEVPHNGFKSTFDMKLRAVLNKPFDQYEHDLLWRQATFRKPVLRHKDLRNQCKSFSTTQIGFSYLDHYPGDCEYCCDGTYLHLSDALRFLW
ncbi:hypothetical protein AXF42_Ash001797 [Apostasia shenzhenica]|uniref:Uncharacterized protein n=1 Tax=Apostasia shenzhenica TaxID=1088818 RepID=A0A2I0ABD2_9ASPA|nr:hypothetical protein AXF42_Ash001797 [Apostasia shenzhenica]